MLHIVVKLPLKFQSPRANTCQKASRCASSLASCMEVAVKIYMLGSSQSFDAIVYRDSAGLHCQPAVLGATSVLLRPTTTYHVVLCHEYNPQWCSRIPQ